MIVAVTVVRVMQPPSDQVVEVIAMRHRLMPAPLAMRMRLLAGRRLGVTVRMRGVDRDRVLVDVVLMRVVQVPVVEVVDVIFVPDRGMPATVAVNMRVRGFVNRVSHGATVQPGTATANHVKARTIPAARAASTVPALPSAGRGQPVDPSTGTPKPAQRA